MASFIWGFPPPSPSPVHPSVFCLLEAKSSTSASCWQTAGVLFSLCPASSASSSLSPSLLCFWLTSTSSWCLRVTAVPCPPLSQVFAVQSQGFPLRIRAFSDSGILGISPPLPRGCAPALSGPAMAVQPYLAQPYLCVSWCHAWDRSCNLWPCCPPGTGLRVRPVLGVAAAGRAPSAASVPKELHPQGSRGQEELFWAFLNAQDGRIATVR